MNRILANVSVFGVGALFSVGLGIAGMTQADKVIGFLSFFSEWDPSLALVMGGAVVAHLLTWRLVTSRPHPIFALEYLIPRRTEIDARLVGGAALFGVGWGLGGYCPGPGITAAVSGDAAPVTFVLTMGLGMLVFHLVQRVSSRPRAVHPPIDV